VINFIAKHLLARVAEQVGTSIGAIIGQRINPEGYVSKADLAEMTGSIIIEDDEPDEDDVDDGDDIDEDEEDESRAAR
jgi:hypothetical protein